MPLGWICALLQCQHTATRPVPTSISPNLLQSFEIVPSQSNQLDQTFPFLSQLVSSWIKVWEPEFPSLSLHLYLLFHPDLSLDAFPPAYSHIFWRSLFLFFPSRPSANWVMKSTSLNPSSWQWPLHLWRREVLQLTANWGRGAQWPDLPEGCEISSSKPKSLNKIQAFCRKYIAWYEHTGDEKNFPMYVMLPEERRVQAKFKAVAFVMEG